LTTVRAPTETVGRIATERLFGLLENQPSSEVQILPTEIVVVIIEYTAKEVRSFINNISSH